MNEPISPQTQFLAVTGSICLIFIIIFLIRRGKLKAGYSLLWLCLAIIIGISSVFNETLFYFSDVIGIYYAPAALFVVLLVMHLLISIHFSTVLSKQEGQIKTLAQEIGLLRQNIQKKDKKA